MLHAGGQRLHTGRHGSDGERRPDRWLRVEEHGLDHIQHVRVSESRATFTSQNVSEGLKVFLFSYF